MSRERRWQSGTVASGVEGLLQLANDPETGAPAMGSRV